MTAQTQAQRNASYRARQRAKIERYEAALREVVGLADENRTDMGLQIAALVAEETLK